MVGGEFPLPLADQVGDGGQCGPDRQPGVLGAVACALDAAKISSVDGGPDIALRRVMFPLVTPGLRDHRMDCMGLDGVVGTRSYRNQAGICHGG